MHNRTLMIVKSHALLNTKMIMSFASDAGLDCHEWPYHVRWPTYSQVQELYKDHLDKSYIHNLVGSISHGVVVSVLTSDTDTGLPVWQRWRNLLGATDPRKALPNTIRAMFGNRREGYMHENACHGSDSAESAEREIQIFFPELF